MTAAVSWSGAGVRLVRFRPRGTVDETQARGAGGAGSWSPVLNALHGLTDLSRPAILKGAKSQRVRAPGGEDVDQSGGRGADAFGAPASDKTVRRKPCEWRYSAG